MVTEKHQATIPTVVRNFLELNPGDRLVFIVEQGHIEVKKGRLEVEN